MGMGVGSNAPGTQLVIRPSDYFIVENSIYDQRVHLCVPGIVPLSNNGFGETVVFILGCNYLFLITMSLLLLVLLFILFFY
jgi:hypothetical protein